MTRVAVIGNAGGGKSTMCRSLSRYHQLPLHAIDQIQWKPNWVRTPDDEYNAAHDALVDGGRWIIDGFGSWASIERRFAAADTIIFVDHPIRVHFWWATKRQIKSIFFGRPDGPEGCAMLPVTIRLYRMMWWIHREMRPRILDALDRASDHARIIHIRSPHELTRFTAHPV